MLISLLITYFKKTLYIKQIFSVLVEYYQYLTSDMNSSLVGKISFLNQYCPK